MPRTNTLSSQLRALNDVAGPSLGALLRAIARAQPPVVRRELAPSLGLSAATVSKAVKYLVDIGLLVEGEPIPDGPGRPIVPLHWSPRYACLGVSVRDRHGLPSEVVGVATTLGGQAINNPLRMELSKEARRDDVALLQDITDVIDKLEIECGDRTILGVGVTVGGHIDAGCVRMSSNVGWGIKSRQWASLGGLELQEALTASVRHPVYVENDVTALAIYENLYTNRRHDSYAVVAVLPDGIGGGLVLRGKPWQGASGMAGEIGHTRVDYTDAAGQCKCGAPGCVEVYATPDAIRGHTNNRRLGEAGRRPATDDQAVEAFTRGGQALARGLAPALNWLNLPSVILFLPPSMEQVTADQAGRAYVRKLRQSLHDEVFSDGGDVDIDVRSLPLPDVENRLASAAASLMLERTIEDLEE